MNNLTVILIYQGYEPFVALLPRIKEDLERQTLPDIKVIVSEQKIGGLIEKGKLYDKHIDDAHTEYILFSDVDAELSTEFCEKILSNIKSNKFDIVFGTLPKRPDYRKATDGIFIIQKDLWLDFRKCDEFELFITAKGIPTYLPLFIKWCYDTGRKIGFEFNFPVRLRLKGNTARGHQRHNPTKNTATIMARELVESGWKAHWDFVDNIWQPSPIRKRREHWETR